VPVSDTKELERSGSFLFSIMSATRNWAKIGPGPNQKVSEAEMEISRGEIFIFDLNSAAAVVVVCPDGSPRTWFGHF
jgi:hypothetical protein